MLASSPSDEEKLVCQAGDEKLLRMETLSMGMDGAHLHIASGIYRFEDLRCPFREGAQPRVRKSIGRVDEMQRMIIRRPVG